MSDLTQGELKWLLVLARECYQSYGPHPVMKSAIQKLTKLVKAPRTEKGYAK